MKGFEKGVVLFGSFKRHMIGLFNAISLQKVLDVDSG